MDTKQVTDALDEFKGSVMQRIERAEEAARETKEWRVAIENDIVRLNRPDLGGSSDRTDARQTKAFYDLLRTGRETEETKAMIAGSDPDGGYSIPPQVDAVLTKYLRDRSVMRQLANIVTGTTSEYTELHSVLGTGATWVGEVGARTTTTSPTFKQVQIAAHEIYASPAVSQKLLDDSQFNLEDWLVTELGDAFADAENDKFINGDGVACPRGLFTYTVATTADATRPHDQFQYTKSGANGGFHTDQADALIALMYSLPPQYRTPGCAWLMSSEVEGKVRMMKEATTNGYIWQAGMSAAAPATLFGWPIYVSDFVPTLATGSLSVAFGRFDRAYTIVDRNTRLLRDPYTNKPYVNFYATKRVGGGGGRDTRAVRFMKFSA